MKKILFVLLLILSIFLVSRLKIQSISCQTQFGDCPEKFTQYYEKYRSKWYFSKITNSFPEALVKSVQIQKRLPDKLIFRLTTRQPIVAISTDQGVDEDGFIMPIDKAALYPQLQILQNTAISTSLSPTETKAVSVLSFISKYVSVNLKAELTENQLNVLYKDMIIRLDMKYLDNNWFSSLQMLLTQSKIAGKGPKIIDLRFYQPVLTY